MRPVRNTHPWYVYVLQNKQRCWYIGSTRNMRKRIFQHNSGKSKSPNTGFPGEQSIAKSVLTNKTPEQEKDI